MDQPTYSRDQFLADVQKQLVSTAIGALSGAQLQWSQVAPLLSAARLICRDDVRLNGRVALHGVEYQGAELAASEEAYLSLSARDRDDGEEWLSHSYWLSDLALADEDPDRVRAAVAAIERSLDKLRDWLAAQEAPSEASGEAGEAPPAP